MQYNAVRNLVYAQLSFFVCLAGAIIINHSGFSDNRGLSFYGEQLQTVVPYGLGFVLCNLFLLRTADELPGSGGPFMTLQRLLRGLAFLLLCVLLTPDTVNSLFNWSHIIASSVLFLYELGIGVWLSVRWYRDRTTLFLLLAQFTSGVLAMLSQFHIIYYLSTSSLFFQIFFGLLIILLVFKLVDRSQAAAETAAGNRPRRPAKVQPS